MVRKEIRSLAVIGLLIVAMFAIVPNVNALQDLKITEYNRWYLVNGGIWVPYGNGELLKWIGDGPRFDLTNPQYKRLKWVGNIPAVTVSDNYGGYWGECVSLGKALSRIQTAGYKRGNRVLDGGIAQGTVIAKFNADGTYDSWGGTGHVAIFNAYDYQWPTSGYGPPKPGFKVWDQNYLPSYGGVIARHSIWLGDGSGTTNADNYYVVQIP